jgi:hypothetical protein
MQDAATTLELVSAPESLAMSESLLELGSGLTVI